MKTLWLSGAKSLPTGRAEKRVIREGRVWRNEKKHKCCACSEVRESKQHKSIPTEQENISHARDSRYWYTHLEDDSGKPISQVTKIYHCWRATIQIIRGKVCSAFLVLDRRLWLHTLMGSLCVSRMESEAEENLLHWRKKKSRSWNCITWKLLFLAGKPLKGFSKTNVIGGLH